MPPGGFMEEGVKEHGVSFSLILLRTPGSSLPPISLLSSPSCLPSGPGRGTLNLAPLSDTRTFCLHPLSIKTKILERVSFSLSLLLHLPPLFQKHRFMGFGGNMWAMCPK
jgi:hypothetical protein